MDIYTVLVILTYLFITTYLGYIGYKRTKTTNDYLVAGRQIHPVIMALSYGATFISTSAIIGYGGAAGKFGMGLLWLTFLNIFVGIFIAFVFFGKRTRKIGHNLDAHTFPEFLGLRYDSRFIRGFAALIIFIFMPIYTGAVLKGAADFIQSYFNISFEAAVLFFVVIVAIYVWMGGLKGVMYTDAFQGVIMFIGMAFLLLFVYGKLGGVVAAHRDLGSLFNNPEVQKQLANPALVSPTSKATLGQVGFLGWVSMPKTGSYVWWYVISTIVMGVGIGVLAQPQLVVRFMTVKSDRELNRAVVSGGVFILMMTGVAFVVGALSNLLFFRDTGSIALLSAGGVEKIIPTLINRYIPGWFGPIFLVTLLAAAMSTLSSQFHTMGTAMGRDMYEKTMRKSGNTLLITRTAILIAILLSTGITLYTKYLDPNMTIVAIGTALFFGLCASTFIPAYIAAIYIKSIPRAAVIWGMVSGFITSFIWIFFINGADAKSLKICRFLTGKDSIVEGTGLAALSWIDPIVIGLPVSIIVTAAAWFVISGIKKKPLDIDSKHLDKCFKGVKA